MLSAWSLALEGERPGALARAARQLARSAELPAHAQRRAGRQGGRASGLRWMLVARELGLLARELRRTHELRGELQRGHEIETELGRELEQVRAMLERGRPSPTLLDSDTATAVMTRQAIAPSPASPAKPADEAEVRRLVEPTRKQPRRQR